MLKPARKSNREFSKSFEISLEGMDNLTDRVDNGIKLRRASKQKSEKLTRHSSSNDIKPKSESITTETLKETPTSKNFYSEINI